MLAFLYNVQCGMKPHHVASDPAILQHAWTWLLDLDVSDKIPGFKVSAGMGLFEVCYQASRLTHEAQSSSQLYVPTYSCQRPPRLLYP